MIMIKRLLFLFAVLAVGLSASASGPQAVFEETSHDFGTIKATGGSVSCDYHLCDQWRLRLHHSLFSQRAYCSGQERCYQNHF